MRFSNAATLFTLASIAQAVPASVHHHAHSHAYSQDYQVKPITPSGQGNYQSGIFYVNWAIYARKHFVTDLPADKFTKINYAFANVNNKTGAVELSDTYADLQYAYPGDVVTNSTTTLLGNFKQLYKLKQANRNLKVFLSIGGWTYRGNFALGLRNAKNRQLFCTTSLTLVSDLGLDGIDIDWEYPKNKREAAMLVDTTRRCRILFDEYSAQYANNYRFEITLSVPAGGQHFTNFPVAALDPMVDGFNLMAFDYQGGGFSNFTGHQSNLYFDLEHPRTTLGWIVDEDRYLPFTTDLAVQYYKSQVSNSAKIVLGMPLYGRSFGSVVDLSLERNGLGQTFNGSGEGTWEPGVLDQKVLPQNGSKVYTNKEIGASWSWDPIKKQFVTFDTPEIAVQKTEYAIREGLGGAWFWESSGDRNITDEKSQIATVVNALGGVQSFEQNMNNLFYPRSKYDNIRNATLAPLA